MSKETDFFLVGVSNGSRQESTLPQAHTESSFASLFCKKMEQDVRSLASYVKVSTSPL